MIYPPAPGKINPALGPGILLLVALIIGLSAFIPRTGVLDYECYKSPDGIWACRANGNSR